MNQPHPDKGGEAAADQIRSIARFREWRQSHGADIPRAALADSLALGYYRPPLQSFQYAAPQTIRVADRQ